MNDHSINPRPIARSGDPVHVYSCGYGSLYNDNIVGPTGKDGTYLRWVWNTSGVVVVPTNGMHLYLWEMYRYPIGRASLEFPRGALEVDESVVVAAARELLEETGFHASSTSLIGELHADTGLISNACSVVLAHIPDERGNSRLEVTEAVSAVPKAVTTDEMFDLIAAGQLTCSITIAAFVLAIRQTRSPRWQ